MEQPEDSHYQTNSAKVQKQQVEFRKWDLDFLLIYSNFIIQQGVKFIVLIINPSLKDLE